MAISSKPLLIFSNAERMSYFSSLIRQYISLVVRSACFVDEFVR